MLYFIGLGLGDQDDITVKGLKAIQACQKVYLEAYTSVLGVDKETLEKVYGKTITVADREMVESQADVMLDEARTMDVAFLVVGDPFGATTHSDLFLRAAKLNIKIAVIHNASIMNAVGACGLQLYHFGQTVSIPFFTETWRPSSFYDKIAVNAQAGLHTLCLLDIKVKEVSEANLFKGRLNVYEPPRFMTVPQALQQLVEVEDDRKEGHCGRERLAVGLMRVGSATQTILAGTIGELLEADEVLFGGPLHSLVIPGKALHDLELEMLKHFAIPNSSILTMPAHH